MTSERRSTSSPESGVDRAAVPDGAHPGDDGACDLCGPAIELTRGGRLSLRHSTERDVAGLRDLYRRLPPHDLRRRFFTAGPPPRMFVQQWASLQDEGGFGLVAELSDGGEDRLVGEAGYSRCGPDGVDHELGITVAPGSRGWLGPWLLDRLLAHAAERGIANLQAVVLADNRAMMTLAAKRGYAVISHPDRGLTRLAMATSGSVPSWTGSGERPRVLIETDRTRWVGEEALMAAGFDIAICAETCRGGHPCPVLEGDSCPLIEGADAVIVDIRDDHRLEELLVHERVVHPGLNRIVVDRPEPGRTGGFDADGLVDRIKDSLPDDRATPDGSNDWS